MSNFGLRILSIALAVASVALPSMAAFAVSDPPDPASGESRKQPAQPADRLTGLGEMIFAGRAAEARERLTAALEAYRRESDPQHEALCLLLLGFSDSALKDIPAAREHLAQGAAKLESTGDRFGSWMALAMLAQLEKGEGSFDAGIADSEKALALLAESAESSAPFQLNVFKSLGPIMGFAPDALEGLAVQPQIVKPLLLKFAEIMTRDAYGELLVEAGQLDKAETQLNEAVAQSAPLSLLFGNMFDVSIQAHIGDLRRRQWHLNEARAAYKKALQGLTALPSVPFKNEWVEVDILGQLADIELLSGHIDDAVAWNDKALTLVRSAGNSKREASVLSDRANLLARGGRFDAAEKAFAQALKIAVAADDLSRQASIWADIGGMHMWQGKYGTAATELESSIQLYQRVKDPYLEASAWTLLSVVDIILDANGNAREALIRARTLSRKSGFHLAEKMVDMLESAQKLFEGKLSGIAMDDAFNKWMSDPEASGLMLSPEYQRILGEVVRFREGPVRETTFPSDPKAVSAYGLPVISALGYMLQGKALLQRGDTAGARELFNKALSENPSSDLRSGYLGLIGATYWKEGKAEEAINFFAKAADAMEAPIGDIKVEEFLSSYLGSERRLYFDILVEKLVEQGRFEEAFDYAERARARAFLNLLGNARLKPAREADVQLATEAEDLRIQIANAARQGVFMAGPDGNGVTVGLQNARQRYEALLSRLKASNPEYASLIKVEPLGIVAVRRGLPPDTTLISYFVSPFRVQAWILDRNTFKHVTLPVDAAGLRRAVCWAEQFGPIRDDRGAVALDSKCGNNRATSEDVYAKLIAPLRGEIRNSRLIIVPHGQLHYIPFAALFDPKSKHYLIQDYTLTYAPSASVLRFLRAKETPVKGKALVLGDPERRDLRPLAGAKDEATSVARMLGTSAVTGPQAAKSLLYHLNGKVDLIHIAAHGFYDPDSPTFSHIALASGSEQDGNLNVQEILADLDLSGVNLVVLSACHSNAGKRSGGDEIAGLTRAILYAGSPGVISTLWSISDEATAPLMEEFYRGFVDGASAADALRQAQVTLIQSGDYSNPKYWAAFCLTGDPHGRWKKAEPAAPASRCACVAEATNPAWDDGNGPTVPSTVPDTLPPARSPGSLWGAPGSPLLRGIGPRPDRRRDRS